MPRYRLHLSACLVAAATALCGCTTGDLGMEAGQLSLAGPMTGPMAGPMTGPIAGPVEADDPVLPDSVGLVPSIYSLAEELAGEEERLVAAVEPSAYSPAAPAGAAAMAVQGPAAGGIAPRSPELDALIARYADHHEIPVDLLRRVVNRESTFDPAARNGPYWGLMQILPQTARIMGYDGRPEGLLDAETNLKYAGRYLRGAYLVAEGDHDLAVRYYSRGYYYDAKRMGLLEATGLGKDRRRMKRDG